jgi:GDSL-like Lipase/Acylhydrolase family
MFSATAGALDGIEHLQRLFARFADLEAASQSGGPALPTASSGLASSGLVSNGAAGVAGPGAARASTEASVRTRHATFALTPGDVRILQFGDSHTAADYATKVVRHTLQARFGDGGRGFLALGQPWPGYVQDAFKAGAMTQFIPERGKREHGQFIGDGLYGLLGIAADSKRRPGLVSSECTAAFSEFELSYLAQPRGGAFDVLIDGAKIATLRSNEPHVHAATFVARVADGPHTLAVRSYGDGPLRVFGAATERAAPGIVLDTLGINGARMSGMLNWSEGHFAEVLAQRRPNLVIFAFGTNESTDENLSIETYERMMVEVLGRVRRAAPTASCLFQGPPDRAVEVGSVFETPQRLLDVVAAQRRVAQAGGCAFYDTLARMGGPGTMARWAEMSPPRAVRDRVHYTKDSYEDLGGAFAADLLLGYDRSKNLSPQPLPSQ